MTFSIYYLSDPREVGIVRYVGATGKPLKERLLSHISESRRVSATEQNPRRKWLKGLLDYGVKPNIHLLESCSAENVELRENFWINTHATSGLLVNKLTTKSPYVWTHCYGSKNRTEIHTQNQRIEAKNKLRSIWPPGILSLVFKDLEPIV